ncbi:Uncharacterised protein [Segatella copri]|nr:Uncharacterised protein [Segatella copri]
MSASTRLLVMSSCLFKASMYGRYIFSNFLWLEMNKYTFIVLSVIFNCYSDRLLLPFCPV